MMAFDGLMKRRSIRKQRRYAKGSRQRKASGETIEGTPAGLKEPDHGVLGHRGHSLRLYLRLMVKLGAGMGA